MYLFRSSACIRVGVMIVVLTILIVRQPIRYSIDISLGIVVDVVIVVDAARLSGLLPPLLLSLLDFNLLNYSQFASCVCGSLSMSLSLSLSLSMPLPLPTCLSVCACAWLCDSLSVCLSICLYTFRFVLLLIRLIHVFVRFALVLIS